MRPTFRRLLAWRLRHLAVASFRLMTRRWHGALLLLMMASPRMMPPGEQLRLLAAPVRMLLRPGAPATSLGVWAALLALAAAWGMLAPGLVDGGAPWRHLRTLPLDRVLLRRVDLAVLAVADLPLMLPFIATLAMLLRLPPGAVAAHAAATLALGAQLPLLQGLLLERSRGRVAVIAGSGLGIAAVAFGGSPWSLVACCMAGDALGLRWPPAVIRAGDRTPPSALRLAPCSATWLQFGRLHLRALLGPPAAAHLLVPTGWSIAPLWAVAVLPGIGLRPEVTPIVVLVLLPPLILGIAGRAFELRRLHAPMRGLLASQGIAARFVGLQSLGAVLLLGTVALAPPAIALAIALGAVRGLWLWPTAWLAVLACAALNTRGDRGVLLPKTALAVGVSWVLLVALTT